MSQTNNCNFVLNGEEYYSKSINSVGSAVSLPFIISSIFVSFIFIICAIYFTYSTYKIANKFTTPTILLLILGLCCLSSFVNAIINYFNAKNELKDTSNSNLERPCFSVQKQMLITEGSNIPYDSSQSQSSPTYL